LRAPEICQKPVKQINNPLCGRRKQKMGQRPTPEIQDCAPEKEQQNLPMWSMTARHFYASIALDNNYRT